MGDNGKLRLVRCPKCVNLLPELAGYPVYQCGGCGAVLQAKTENHGEDGSSEKSEDEERLGGLPAKSENSLDKGMVDVSDTDVKGNGDSLSCCRTDSKKDEIAHTEGFGNESNVATDSWVTKTGLNTNKNRDALGEAVGKEQGEISSEFGRVGRFQRSGRMSDWKLGERRDVEGFRRNPRSDVEGVRFSTSNYPDEGPSNYNLDSSYAYGESSRNSNDPDGTNIKCLEQDRAELLRKLDELKDQLSQSCNVADKQKERVPVDGRVAPPDPYGGPETWFQNGSSVSNRVPMQFSGPDKHVSGNHWPDLFPYANRHEMAMNSFFPPVHNPNHNPGYGDPFGPEIPRRAPHHSQGQYPRQPLHPYFSGQYIDTNPNSFELYPPNTMFHQPSCTCLHCYDTLQRVSAPVPPPSLCNKRFPDVPNNPVMYHHKKPGAFGPLPHSSRTIIPPPSGVSNPQRHTRWPSGFVRYHPRRVVLTSGAHYCRPMAGGAPFVTCYNCFEVLQLPKKLMLTVNNQRKMQCGACSAVINFAVINKKLVLSVHAQTKDIPMDVDGGSNKVMKDRASHFHGHLNMSSANFSSDDYDVSGYDFHSMDREPVSLSVDQHLNSNNVQKMGSFHSSSSSTSKDENVQEVLIASKEVKESCRQPTRAIVSPPPPGSPLQEHFDYSSNTHAVDRFGRGNRSSRSDQEKVKTNKAASRQNSLKEASLATEMDVSFNEYSNTGVSQDSGDASREDNQPRNKGGESFFANIIKKSFKDFSKSNQTDQRSRSNVSINGHLIPERVVRKAEKLTGPIQPGKYWYDFRAGFWGVMGGSCLGIVPPFIEEFNYPMPDNCAGGNTSVFVNGRELHQKDLDLLAGRGLSTARDRSYIIEISGRVLDEDTGEELDSLGKLAPTVEKAGHGFGMKAPRSAHNQ